MGCINHESRKYKSNKLIIKFYFNEYTIVMDFSGIDGLKSKGGNLSMVIFGSDS